MYYLNSLGEVRSSDIFPVESRSVGGIAYISTNNYYNETVDEKATGSIRSVYPGYSIVDGENISSIILPWRQQEGILNRPTLAQPNPKESFTNVRLIE